MGAGFGVWDGAGCGNTDLAPRTARGKGHGLCSKNVKSINFHKSKM